MEIKNIFVVGAGFMGSGIAQTAIQSGYNVTIHDQSEAALERAKTNIGKNMDRLVSKGRMTEEQKAAALALLTTSSSIHTAANADLVIEAIFEDLNAKRAIFEELDKICPKDTIFASNTSSISLTSLAAATSRASGVQKHRGQDTTVFTARSET